MASSNLYNYEQDRIFLIQPLQVETCKFLAESILKNHNEDFYIQANASKFEAVGNSFFCSSRSDAERIATCLNRFSDKELSFIVLDITDSCKSSELTQMQLSQSVKMSGGVQNILKHYCTDLLILDDKTSLKGTCKESKERQVLKLKLKLKLAIHSEKYEVAAQIRDELKKYKRT